MASGVGDGTAADLADRLAEYLAPVTAHEVPADLLQVRADHPGQEPGPRVLPDAGPEPLLKIGPPGPHDRLVEADQRLHDPVPGAPAVKAVRVPDHQAAVLKDPQRVRDLRGLAPDIAGDAAPPPVAAGDGGQHGVVERGLPDVGFLSEQVPGLA
jgi:hypothetical protein